MEISNPVPYTLPPPSYYLACSVANRIIMYTCRVDYSQTSDSGPSEIGAQYNNYLGP